MKLAIFDFDGTITRKDSFEDFIFYCHGTLRTILGIIALSPILLLFSLKLLSNSQVKEIVIKYFYRGWDKDSLEKIARKYTQNHLPQIIRKSALAKIQWHKGLGHKIVVVSASPEFYLKNWCQEQNLELLATRIEFQDNKVTGRLDGKNCHGKEKIRRLMEKYDLKNFEYIYAYGDSPGDKTLVKIAHEFHYRSFQK